MNTELKQLQNRMQRTQKPDCAQPAKRTRERKPQNATLSPRQIEIARLVARGLTDKEIGNQLRMTEGNVGWHLKQVFLKWQIHSRTALAARFIQETLPPTNTTILPPPSRT